MEPYEEDLSPPGNPADDSIIVFLGLYLLLVAFFILLNSISSYSEEKAKSAMSSVNNAFRTLDILSPDAELFSSDVGSFAAASASFAKLGDLVQTAIELARVNEVRPGQLMEIEIPTTELFIEGESTMTKQALGMLDKIGKILAAPPPELHYDVSAVVGSEWILSNALEKKEPLALARAGTLARELRARGAPEDATLAAIEYGTPEKTKFVFRVFGLDAGKVTFEELLEEGAP